MDDFLNKTKLKNNKEDKFIPLKYFGKINLKNMVWIISNNIKNGQLNSKKHQVLQILLISINLDKILEKENLEL